MCVCVCVGDGAEQADRRDNDKEERKQYDDNVSDPDDNEELVWWVDVCMDAGEIFFVTITIFLFFPLIIVFFLFFVFLSIPYA